MVVNRGEMKRKRKEDNCINLIDHSPKRTKVQAQRKFAQGSNVSSPVITPIKEIDTLERRDVLPEPIELLPMKRPNTEDFLTFLCFRGTPILPPNLNFFNSATMVDSPPDDRKETKNGPIMTGPIGKSPNERPFVAFGVRKRADPVVISKQMDKKRRHALALQTLRRKYQEQKMAKIRAIAVSKISEKITSSKTIVRTRSISKTETVTKKEVAQKSSKVKVVATKRIARRTIKQPIRTNINPNIKSKMCLRSFRGRYIHRELQVRTAKTKPKPNKRRILKRIENKEDTQEEELSEFSSDDDEPLVKKAKLKKASAKIVKKPIETIKKQEASNLRLTRSQRLIGSTRKHTYKTVITRLSTIRATRLGNKKIVQKSAIMRNSRRTVETIKKTSKRIVEGKPAILETVVNKKSANENIESKKDNDIKTRSKTEKGSKSEVKKLVKTTNDKKERTQVLKKTSKLQEPPKKVVKLQPKIETNKKSVKPNPIIKKKLVPKVALKSKTNTKMVDEKIEQDPKVKCQSNSKKNLEKKPIEPSKKIQPEQSKKPPVEQLKRQQNSQKKQWNKQKKYHLNHQKNFLQNIQKNFLQNSQKSFRLNNPKNFQLNSQKS